MQQRSTAALAALVLALCLTTCSAQQVAVDDGVSYFEYPAAPKVTNATNQKGLLTWGVTSTFTEQFKSVQSCLPLSLQFNTANNASVTSYKFLVNTTNLDQSYNLHPYVKNGVFTLALNGTLTSTDLVNVTVTVPDDYAAQIVNVTATGQSYIAFNFKNVTQIDTFQAQIAATGVVTLVHNVDNLVVYASTNGSATLDGKLNNVYLNYASTQPVVLTNAQALTLAKSGKGSVFIGNVTKLAQIAMTGSGAVSANQTYALNLIQQGTNSALIGVIREANISYAGGKNTTFIDGLGTVANGPATVNYFNSGNGTLIFTGDLTANGVAPPANSCLNITGFSNKACNESAVIPVPKNPEFPPKRPRCKGGSFILKNSEQCYAQPTKGYQCQTVPPVNGGYKFLLIFGIFVIAAIMIWINSI